jgi:hypothetical protein
MTTLTSKYEAIARQRQNEHLDGKRSYASYLYAYEQYKRACEFYGQIMIFVHITASKQDVEARAEKQVTEMNKPATIIINKQYYYVLPDNGRRGGFAYADGTTRLALESKNGKRKFAQFTPDGEFELWENYKKQPIKYGKSINMRK